jgi:hypothetical protein
MIVQPEDKLMGTATAIYVTDKISNDNQYLFNYIQSSRGFGDKNAMTNWGAHGVAWFGTIGYNTYAYTYASKPDTHIGYTFGMYSRMTRTPFKITNNITFTLSNKGAFSENIAFPVGTRIVVQGSNEEGNIYDAKDIS